MERLDWYSSIRTEAAARQTRWYFLELPNNKCRTRPEYSSSRVRRSFCRATHPPCPASKPSPAAAKSDFSAAPACSELPDRWGRQGREERSDKLWIVLQ